MDIKQTKRAALKQVADYVQKHLQAKGHQNKLFSRIYSKLKELEYDEVFLTVAHSHVKILQENIKKWHSMEDLENLKFKFKSIDEGLSFYIAKFFIDKMHHFSPIDLCPVPVKHGKPIECVPIEAFLQSDAKTKEEFEKNLKREDVLYAELVKTDGTYDKFNVLELRIICKDDSKKSIVYHHNISVFMCKAEVDHCLGLEELSLFEILKVAMMGTVHEEKKHLVSVNSKYFSDSFINLGVVSPVELNFNFSLFKAAQQFSSYTEYLKNQPSFSSSRNLKEEIQSLGIDPYKIYSFRDESDGLTFEYSDSLEALRGKAKLDLRQESHKHFKAASNFARKKDYLCALAEFDEALKCWPENHKVYESRGKMYVDMHGMAPSSDLKKACLDFETALRLNPSAAQVAKETFSKILSNFAISFEKANKLEKAKENALFALQLNKRNHEARRILRIVEVRLSALELGELKINEEKDMDNNSLSESTSKSAVSLKGNGKELVAEKGSISEQELSPSLLDTTSVTGDIPITVSECVVITIEISHRCDPNSKNDNCIITVKGFREYEIEHLIKKVVFLFDNMNMVVKKSPFCVEQSFKESKIIPVHVYFKGPVVPHKLCFKYDLDIKKSSHVCFESIPFNDPTPELYNGLLKAGGVIVL